MLTVTAREANQHFLKFLLAASRGEEVTITRRGRPVAKLVPIVFGEEETAALEEAMRQAALERLAIGYPGTSCDSWTRDEIYDERFERPWQLDDKCDQPSTPTFSSTRHSAMTAVTCPQSK